jgi:hypothetical protein
MSRTYRKYPVVEFRSNGNVYNDWDSLPTRDWITPVYKRVITGHITERVYKSLYSDTPKIVQTPVYSWIHTGEMETTQRQIDYACDYYFHRKSMEGNPNVVKAWNCGSVGKYNKQLRSRYHRSRTKEVLSKLRRGFLDCEIPVEKNHDRWDYW